MWHTSRWMRGIHILCSSKSSNITVSTTLQVVLTCEDVFLRKNKKFSHERFGKPSMEWTCNGLSYIPPLWHTARWISRLAHACWETPLQPKLELNPPSDFLNMEIWLLSLTILRGLLVFVPVPLWPCATPAAVPLLWLCWVMSACAEWCQHVLSNVSMCCRESVAVRGKRSCWLQQPSPVCLQLQTDPCWLEMDSRTWPSVAAGL